MSNIGKQPINIPDDVNKEPFIKMLLERIENRTKPSVPIIIKSLRVQKDLN